MEFSLSGSKAKWLYTGSKWNGGILVLRWNFQCTGSKVEWLYTDSKWNGSTLVLR